MKNWLIRKDPDVGKHRRQEEKGIAEYDMVGWHHRLNGHEFEQALGVGDGQGRLACCSPWGAQSQTWLSNWTDNFLECVFSFPFIFNFFLISLCCFLWSIGSSLFNFHTFLNMWACVNFHIFVNFLVFALYSVVIRKDTLHDFNLLKSIEIYFEDSHMVYSGEYAIRLTTFLYTPLEFCCPFRYAGQ